MLRLVLPKGSLERSTMELFEAADLHVKRASEVDYRATIDDERIESVRILRPQEIPSYLEQGLFDLGITGRDWIEETQSNVVSIGELEYSKNTTEPIKVVLAVDKDSPIQSIADFHNGVRISTEFVGLTRRYFESYGINANVFLSYGATEAKVPEIADAVVDLTETGRALRAAGLRIVETILISKTELVANQAAYENEEKRHAMKQMFSLLQGALSARGKVLLKFNVPEAQLADVVKLTPTAKSPTISKLFGDDGYAVETVVPKKGINSLIPKLKDAGATDILELPIGKIIP